MVNQIRKALAGFLLMPGKPSAPLPDVPHLPENVIVRASSLRGYSDKDKPLSIMALAGHEESDVLRRLRSVIVENEAPDAKLRYEDGMNLVVFRGVFGSGGYGLEVKKVAWNGSVLEVECDFENPGDGIRTTAGFTQPAAIIPLKRLPEGKYKVRLLARDLRRSSQGVQEEKGLRELASTTFKVAS
ncbi:MAG: protease complex subunit PrcB family protein [Planctomycetota bacterium]|nr:protease complex subunit PrcB family protein [Planctomycetota bacterium]